jgi:hypothetical protein
LLSSSIASIIEGVYIFLSGNRRYIRVFKLLVYLGIRAYLAVLPRGLYYRNLSLLEGPSCLYATAFHKVFIEFPFRSSRDFKGE